MNKSILSNPAVHFAAILNSEAKDIQLICLDSAFIFRLLSEQKPHSLIMTSSALEPMNHFEIECGLAFPLKVQVPFRLTDSKQFTSGVVFKSKEGRVLNLNYE